MIGFDAMAGKKVKIGDVVEIKTPSGLAYVQYTHDSNNIGQIVRVLPGLYSVRPTNFSEFVRQKELYFIFYTLKYALRARQVEIVSNEPIPGWAQPVPTMRHPAGTAPDGRTLSWRIVPALAPLTIEFLQRTPVIRELTPEQLKLSIRVLWPHPATVKELARGWTPERSEALEEEDRTRADAEKKIQPSAAQADQTMRHYLYFPRKKNAKSAGELLRNRGFSVEVRKGADGENWLALAAKTPPTSGEEMEELRDQMEALAAQFGGEYDGWEAPIESLSSDSSKRSVKVN